MKLKHLIYYLFVIGSTFSIYSQFLFPSYLDLIPRTIGADIENYRKNKWTRQEVTSDDKYYTYSYKFKDHNNKTRIWTWNAPRKESDEMINNFGVPRGTLSGILGSKERDKRLKKGYLHILDVPSVGNMLIPNYDDIISDSRPLVIGIADIVKDIAREEKLNGREVVDLILAFCQDIPYGLPPQYRNERYIYGIFPPPLSLNNRWCDCDSKAVLFGSIYHAITSNPIVMVMIPGHLFVGVPAIPGPYDKTVVYKGKDYIIAEQTGPNKVALGQHGKPFAKVEHIFPVKLNNRLVRPELPIYSEGKVLGGNSIIFLLKEEGARLGDKRIRFVHRHSDKSNWKGSYLIPQNDHSLKYSTTTAYKMIEVSINPRWSNFSYGYYYDRTKYDMSKEDEIEIDFSEGKCIYIISKPDTRGYLLTIDDNFKRSIATKRFKTDSLGIFRAIMPTGNYTASLDEKPDLKDGLSGLTLEERKMATGSKTYDRENRIGIRFDL